MTTAAAETQTYFLAILHHGPKFVADGQPGAMVLNKQHQSHLAQLANLGVLVLGGSCGEQADSTDPLVAMCVLDAPTLDKATKYIQQDPAVIAGHLRAEVIPWLGPKGLCLRLPPAADEAPAADGATPAAEAPAAGEAAAGAPAAGADGAAPAAGGAAPAPTPAPAPAAGAPAAGGGKAAGKPRPSAAPAGGARKPAPAPTPAPAPAPKS